MNLLNKLRKARAISSPEVQQWKKEAEEGNTDSQFELALAYKFGVGTARNLVEACIWFQVASDSGHSAAGCEHVLINYKQSPGLVPSDLDDVGIAAHYRRMAITCPDRKASCRTGLHWMVVERHIEQLKFLLEKTSIDIEAKDANGQTALDLAREIDSAEIIALLEQYQ